MRKMIKRIVLGLLILAAAIMLPYFVFKTDTKSYSPEDTVTYHDGHLELEVFYNRPYKKGRNIFGELVPFGEVWRTGANEATTFETNLDLLVDGSLLPAGSYTLWTIPMEDSWKVVFNSKMYPWGITADKKASREPAHDVLVVEVPVQELQNVVEQFTIRFQEVGNFVELQLLWDQTLIIVPLKPSS